MFPAPGKVEGCAYGYTFGVATPANLSDPFFTNWKKSDLNPIVNDTFDDPSGAWETADGEWRWIANCDETVGECGSNSSQAPLYGASDSTFETARLIGLTNLQPGECPSLFDLPPLSSGTGTSFHDNTSRLPTHVHKWGCEPYQDCVELGFWHEASASGGVGFWEPHSDLRIIDKGSAYAAKGK